MDLFYCFILSVVGIIGFYNAGRCLGFNMGICVYIMLLRCCTVVPSSLPHRPGTSAIVTFRWHSFFIDCRKFNLNIFLK